MLYEVITHGVQHRSSLGTAFNGRNARKGLSFQIFEHGATGPYAEFAGNDLVVAALGGPVALQGIAA